LCVFIIIWKAGAFLLARRSQRDYAERGLSYLHDVVKVTTPSEENSQIIIIFDVEL